MNVWDAHKQVIVQVQPVEHEQLQFEVSSIAKGSNRITGTITEEHMDVLSPQAVSTHSIAFATMVVTVTLQLLYVCVTDDIVPER
jgi:hypothetical protein